ncbi:MAG: TGS domain-containing protein [Firmicutes bacterium]|nr:TGS domain-containing protein [Bacillota bacterium]HOB35260.1 TGS domain-containing protein [Bacillota bacterium]HPZ89794.1 TGS domain-containing protein [Bacillota bacterium]HQE01190.1 TGS domain-containing protein [Bacillota bacterium]
MPANLTQQYHAAEEAYRKATTYEEKLAALEEMLATIPKHKGTEKLQADIKKRLARLRREGEKPKGGGSRQEDPFLIERQGAGQIFLLGWPNAGKSALVGALTNARVQVAEYPFATALPVPGMMQFEDVGIQLVDAPPFMPEGISGNFTAALRNSDMLLLVVDLSDHDCVEHLDAMLKFLQEKRILRDEVPPGVRALTRDKVLVLGNKSDLADSAEMIGLIRELVPDCPDILPVSASTGENLQQIGPLLFRRLQVIRVYTKKPGKKPDLDRPFILPQGSTVYDLAESIHKDIAENLRTARVWGSAKFDGQAVNHDYVLSDRDIVELNG